MKILLVFAHPDKQGLNGAILKQVQKGLLGRHEVELLDLYETGFDPVLVFNQEQKRRDLAIEPVMAPYREQINWADQLIFIYPIWWGGMPAILKGYIDRVFTKDFAYSYRGMLPIGHLKGKKAWIITTNDVPKIYYQLFQQDYGRILKKQVLHFCGIKQVKHFSLDNVRGKKPQQIEGFLGKIYQKSLNL